MFQPGDLVERVRNPQLSAALKARGAKGKMGNTAPPYGKPVRVEAVIPAGRRICAGVVIVGYRSKHPTGGFAAPFFRKIVKADEAFIASIRQKADA